MKVLKVIHGYPPRYNAGSEVYSQGLCHALADLGNKVAVFTREEDPFRPDGELRSETDPDDGRITLFLVNNPRHRDRYRDEVIDRRFEEVLDRLQPDIVHIGHLSHLSTSLVTLVARREIPIVFTLHDFWLMCPRGQFLSLAADSESRLLPVCDRQDDARCASECYRRYWSGSADEETQDLTYWTDWVRRRMTHVRAISDSVDLMIAPSKQLLERFRNEFGISPARIRHLDYGFDHGRLRGRLRVPDEPFTFGYIGTHIPAKGIRLLIDAFSMIRGDARLRIWGRHRGQETDSLIRYAESLSGEVSARIEWLPEYRNQDIVADVFNRVDAIVVPSIWVENSPLVIHEAQQVRVPVLTADIGGMAEFVMHRVNGLLFDHRSSESLANCLQQCLDAPAHLAMLGLRGYLGSDDGDVPNLTGHAREMQTLYEALLRRRDALHVVPRASPWRITFDTNPDLCNLRCVMCEEHSPHADRQPLRRAAGAKRREMSIEIIERVIAECAPQGLKEVIPSTMGEPLLYPHFDRILELCQQHGVHLNLTTNGTFPHRGAREWAARICPVASDVKISWNGARPATQAAVMTGAQWETMLDNLRNFIAVRDSLAAAGGHRCQITLQMTFLERNVGELADIARLAIGLGVDRLKGHHLWAHFGEIEDQSMRKNEDSIRRWNLAVADTEVVVKSTPLANGKFLKLDNITPLALSAVNDLAPDGACPFLGQEAWINTEGRFDPCCAPDTDRRTLGDFGTVNRDGLQPLWDSKAYRFLTASYRNRKLCIRCNMRQPAS